MPCEQGLVKFGVTSGQRSPTDSRLAQGPRAYLVLTLNEGSSCCSSVPCASAHWGPGRARCAACLPAMRKVKPLARGGLFNQARQGGPDMARRWITVPDWMFMVPVVLLEGLWQSGGYGSIGLEI